MKLAEKADHSPKERFIAATSTLDRAVELSMDCNRRVVRGILFDSTPNRCIQYMSTTVYSQYTHKKHTITPSVTNQRGWQSAAGNWCILLRLCTMLLLLELCALLLL